MWRSVARRVICDGGNLKLCACGNWSGWVGTGSLVGFGVAVGVVAALTLGELHRGCYANQQLVAKYCDELAVGTREIP